MVDCSSTVVSVSYQLHGVTGVGNTTKHIYIDTKADTDVLMYFDPATAAAGTTGTKILFEIKKNEYHISSLFPGFSTMNLKGQLYFAKALLGGDGLNRTISQYMIDREDYIFRNPKSVLTYGIQTLYLQDQDCPNRFLTVDQDDPEMQLVYISINDVIPIFAINVYDLFEIVWTTRNATLTPEQDASNKAVRKLYGLHVYPTRGAATSGVTRVPANAEQIIIPLDVLNKTVKKFINYCTTHAHTPRWPDGGGPVELFRETFSSTLTRVGCPPPHDPEKQYMFISYLDNCSPFFNDFDLTAEYAQNLRTAIVMGIQTNQIFVRELKKNNGSPPRLTRKETAPAASPGFISIDKYDDGFLSGLQVLKEFDKIMTMLIDKVHHNDDEDNMETEVEKPTPATPMATATVTPTTSATAAPSGSGGGGVGNSNTWRNLQIFVQKIIKDKFNLKTILSGTSDTILLLGGGGVTGAIERKCTNRLVEHITAISNIKMATQELVFHSPAFDTSIGRPALSLSIKNLSKKFRTGPVKTQEEEKKKTKKAEEAKAELVNFAADPKLVIRLLNIIIVTNSKTAALLRTQDPDHGKRLQLKSRRPKKGNAIYPRVVFWRGTAKEDEAAPTSSSEFQKDLNVGEALRYILKT